MITAPFWTRITQAFRDDKYVCSACRYIAEKPYPDCPACGTVMSGSRYASEWIDEAEKSDLFPEEEENVASRLTTAFRRVCRMTEEAVRKKNRRTAAVSDNSSESRTDYSNPYIEHTYTTGRRIYR